MYAAVSAMPANLKVAAMAKMPAKISLAIRIATVLLIDPFSNLVWS
jgi:hypothetical protein